MKQSILWLCMTLTAAMAMSQGITLPYATAFDDSTEQAGWVEYRQGFNSTYHWSFAGGGVNNSKCLSHDYNVGGNSGDTVIDWMVSPLLNYKNTGNMNMQLEVKTGGFSTPTIDNFEVWVGTGSQNPTLGYYQKIANLSYMLPQYQWNDTIIESIPHIADSVYIAFRYKTIGAAWTEYAVENVEIWTDSVSSVIGKKKSFGVNIYPNPFHETTTFIIDEKFATYDDMLLTICDLSGREVKKIAVTSSETLLERGNLQSGVYFINLTKSGHIAGTYKIILN